MVNYKKKSNKRKFSKKIKKILKRKNQRKKYNYDFILIGSKKFYNLPKLNEKIKQNPNNDIGKKKNENNLIVIDKIKKEDRIIQTEVKKTQNNIKVIKIDNNNDNNKSYNNIMKHINPEIINIKNYKPKGLENFNLNCYMNSLLQCLFYLKDFRKFFLENNFEKNQLICQAMKDVMIGLNTYDGKSYYSPRKMKNEIKKDNIFKDGEGSDVTDLLDFIFVGVSSELEKDISSNHTVEYQTQTQDKRLVYEEIYNEINFDVIINELFVGFYEKEFKCLNNHIKYSFQSEYRIVFTLEEIFSYYKGKNVLTLYDCFNHYTRIQKIDESEEKNQENEDSNSFDNIIHKSDDEEPEEESELNKNEEGSENFDKCPNCEKKYTLIEKVFRTPKYLIIILDRGYKKKCDKTVIFDEEIDLSDYLDDERYEYQTKYKLTGICVHHGRAGNSGHYTSICLCDDNNYYHLNDSCSTPLKSTEKLYNDSPYILFYSRLDLTTKQNIIKSFFYKLRHKIAGLIKEIELMEEYSIIKINDLYLLKYIITETKYKTINTFTIQIDFSEFNHKTKNPKITIIKIFKGEKREKEEKETIYWDDKISNEENKEKFEIAIESYFKEFGIKNKIKKKKSIGCYLF